MSNGTEGIQSPEVIDEATKEVLDALEAEGHEVDRPDKAIKSEAKPEPKPILEKPKPEEKPIVEPPKEPEKPKPEEKPETPRKPRSVKMVPAWQLEVANDKNAKLAADLEKARQAPAPAPNVPETPKPTNSNLDAAIKKHAEKSGLDEADVRELANAILDGFKPKTELPKEILEELKGLKDFKQSQETKFNEVNEMTEYGKEFERDLVPLVKAKYPDISEVKIGELKAKLADIAFTDEYAKLSLVKVFRAEEDAFVEIFPAPSKPSAESGRGGAGRDQGGVVPMDYDDPNLDISKLTDTQLDEFNTHQLAKENQFSQ